LPQAFSPTNGCAGLLDDGPEVSCFRSDRFTIAELRR
jgi:hypothetical protein